MEDPIPQAPSNQESQIVNRLASLPVVTNACDRLVNLYQQTKGANRLLCYTLETSESCLKTVNNTAMPYYLPYVHTLDKPISTLDHIACDGLDMLQERYPLIKAPSQQVYSATMKPAVDYSMDKIDVATEQVISVKKCGAQRVQAVNDTVCKAKDYTINHICTARDQGLEQVVTIRAYTSDTWEGVKGYSYSKYDTAKIYGTDKVMEALGTPYGQVVGHVVSKQLDYSLEWSEKFIDQYLPEVEELGEHKEDDTEDADPSPVERALSLTSKTKQRLCHHALINLKLIRVRTQETVDKLNFTTDLIAYAKTNLAILSSMLSLKLNTIWREINQTDEEVSERILAQSGPTTESGIEDRLIATARHVMHMCKRGISATSQGLSVVPAFFTEQFAKLKTYTDDLQELIRVAGGLSEVRAFLLELTREKMATYQVMEKAQNMMLVCIEKASLLQDKFTLTKDYITQTPFMNWMGLNSKEQVEQELLEMEAITASSHEKKE